MKEIACQRTLGNICYGVQVRVLSNVFQAMETIGLTELDPRDDDWMVSGNMTEEGMFQIINNVDRSLEQIFLRSSINYPNVVSYQNPEVLDYICDRITHRMGKPKINVLGNEIEIKFNGSIPLIRSIAGYLDPSVENPPQIDIKDINFFPRGIQIMIPMYSLDN